jgi:MazG family protein
MHAEIAREAGQFDVAAVINEVSEKLVRRHPHVFGESDARDTGAVVKQWEAIKREEKKKDSHYLAGLPAALPALMRAQKAQTKVARVNFDWTELKDVVAKVDEEVGETKSAIEKWHRRPADESGSPNASAEVEDEIGDLLFAVVNLARKCGIDAETALQKATDKFRARFNRVEDEVKARGKQLGEADLAELDGIWEQIKKEASSTPNAQRPNSNASSQRRD